VIIDTATLGYVVNDSDLTPWYGGKTVLGYLEDVPIAGDGNYSDFRYPVQYVLRPNLNYRGFSAQIASGVVKKGDPICRIRDVKRRLAVDEMKARAESLKSEIAARQSDVRKTEFELDRIKRLSELGRSTEKEQIDSVANHAATLARLRQAEAMSAEAEAALGVAQDNLERTVMTAPFDGAVTKKLTELGQWVDVGAAIAELVDLSVIRARINVPESAISSCNVGEDVLVSVDALGRDFKGTVSRVVPDADPQANTFPVEIDIDNADGTCRAGMFIRAMVPAGPKAKRMLVPKDAVITRGPTSMVYVARKAEKGHMADIAPVTIVAEVMEFVAVESPSLQPGDLAIVRGNESLRGPGPVNIVSGDAPIVRPEKPGEIVKSREPVDGKPDAEATEQDSPAESRHDSQS